MIVHIKDSGAIVAPVEIEESDDAKYIGHYTVDALDQFVTELKKNYQPQRMLSVKVIYNDGYILAGTPDDDGGKYPIHIAMAGCNHGKDGSE